MATSTETLNVLIKAKDLYTDELNNMQKKFSKAGAAIAGIMAATTAAVLKMSKETANLAQELNKWSIITGVNIEELSKLRFITERSGLEVNHMYDALKELNVKMKEAQEGTGGLFDNMRHLDLSVVGVDGQLRDTSVVFDEIVQKLATMENAALRTAIADEIWSDAGTELLPVLIKNKDELVKLRGEAEKYGHVITEETAKSAVQLNNDMRELEGAVKGLSFEIGETLIPTLAKSATWWTENIKGAKEFFGVLEDRRTVQQLNADLAEQQKLLKEASAELKTFRIFSDTGRESAIIEGIKREIAAINERRAALLQEKSETGGPAGTTITSGATIISPKEAAEMQSFMANLNVELANISANGFQMQEELRQNSIDTEIAQFEAGFQEQMSMEIAKNEALGQLSLERYAEEERKRKADLEAEKQTGILRRQAAQNTAQGIVSLMEAMNTLADGKNRELFNLLKVARASQAIVDTYAAANNALASVPYPYNFVAAGTVIAAGIANLAVIQRTQFGGGGGGGGATIPAASPPVVQLPDQTGIGAGVQAGPTNITIEITGVINAEDVVELVETEIIPAINTSLGRNATTLNI